MAAGVDGVRIEYMDLATLVRAPRNPKGHDLSAIQHSLDRFGFVAPIIVDDATGRLVAGHGRVDALQQRKASGQSPPARIKVEGDRWLIPVVAGIAFQSPMEAESYLVADNQTTMLGAWDDAELAKLLSDLAAQDSLGGTGFDADDLDELLRAVGGGVSPEAGRQTLAERFGVPPFSVLDARQGYWQERKRAWLSLGIQSEIGRGGGATLDDERDGATAQAVRRPNSQERQAPGGSLMPATDYSKRQRGDGLGRAIR